MHRRATRPRVMAIASTSGVMVLALALAGCGAGSITSSGTPTSVVPPPAASPSTSTTSSPIQEPPPTRVVTAPASATPTPTATVATSSPAPTRLAPAPKAGAEPRIRFPANQGAVGTGANASAGPIPNAVWARMVGYSWVSGCPVGRSSLRYVTVNFWGFDGRRSRGAVVVNASIASRTKAAFTKLYEQRFRIRQMKVMDSAWGHNPKGPGADDYAAMEADNTSAFNCRYVGGEESAKVWSKHAYGMAIDINDFENPYVDAAGRVYPDAWFLSRRSARAGVFSSASSAAVRALTAQGFRWGGAWNPPDYQHFDLAR